MGTFKNDVIAIPETTQASDVKLNFSVGSILKDAIKTPGVNEQQDAMDDSTGEILPEKGIQVQETSESKDLAVNNTSGWRTLNGKCPFE